MKPIAAAALAFSMLNTAGAAEPEIRISRAASRPVQSAPAQNFTGTVQVEMLFTPDGGTRTSAGKVRFAPGARTAWHTHPLGQTLIVTEGVGRVQRWGGPVEEIRPGDVVRIPPHARHWHGAAPDSAMAHIAIQEAQDGKTVDWLEQVSEQDYQAKPRTDTSPTPSASAAQPSRAQQLLGDVAPKLAQLTDDVLFGDVWARPGLSPRDRSLVTVSALIAMNRPDQLRSHMALARQNGVTESELVEALTHLAFYAGWPNAVTAVGVARDVFKAPVQ
ncbi:carboxymuconolactone decarboxylase family protein [Acidovorax sp. SUPP2522]|uniref:(R)-mandelonitrile lyase n=1 Tax=unclassified Acidovorax TaxID=2684926 RepID=UPI002349B398|nr:MULTISPECIES: carboxymuconolactone decarboxylase family protein [unclassified Acidovorax]WCM97628.1 carboxymuconolactone decarboxylase family protein [Acidovorax sp. GBBC 1281]GKT13202.1 carboxymuconolactone decarboxylase family protein [Acidovorax sp. SUPP2522]